jgi:hypothetical protein
METEEKDLEKMVEDLKKEYYNQYHFFQVSFCQGFCILVDEPHTRKMYHLKCLALGRRVAPS